MTEKRVIIIQSCSMQTLTVTHLHVWRHGEALSFI